jgi:PAS domain S-box-containing protein
VWDSSVDGLAVVSGDGRMVLVNPALERMFGYLPGELTGALVDLLVPDQARQPPSSASCTAPSRARPRR